MNALADIHDGAPNGRWRAFMARFSDIIILMKPRVTALVIMTTAGGFWMGRSGGHALDPMKALGTLLGTTLLVGAANSMNMYLERDLDRLMERTANRPLPSGRMSPDFVLTFGVVLCLISIIILGFFANTLTALLGLIAFVSYVFFYTPLKQRTTFALLVGAVPGAMPPLMGWTAATGEVSLPGLILFLILFLWQVPHFQAIALFHKDEYGKAGLKILPLEQGDEATKHAMIRYLFGLVAVSLYPVAFGVAGMAYFWVAALLGGVFFAWGLWGLRKNSGVAWAKSFFLFSIIYLPLLLAVLVWDAKS